MGVEGLHSFFRGHPRLLAHFRAGWPRAVFDSKMFLIFNVKNLNIAGKNSELSVKISISYDILFERSGADKVRAST